MSIKQIVSDYACSAGSLFMPTYYDNMAALRQLCVDCPQALREERWIPLLILHGEKDDIIRPYHAQSLYDEAVRLGHPSVEARKGGRASESESWDSQTGFRRTTNPRADLGRHLFFVFARSPNLETAAVLPWQRPQRPQSASATDRPPDGTQTFWSSVRSATRSGRQVCFSPMATHNEWDLLIDLAAPISKWMYRYMVCFRGPQSPTCAEMRG